MGNTQRKSPSDALDDVKIDIRVGINQTERAKEDLEEKASEMLAQAKEAKVSGKDQQALQIAKRIVRCRAAADYLAEMIGSMEDALLLTDIVKVQNTLQTSIISVTRVLSKINVGISLPDMARMMQRFEREKDAMELKQDQVAQTIDGSMNKFDDEEAEKTLLKQVMDEIGLEANLPLAASTSVVSDEELQKRIQNLK